MANIRSSPTLPIPPGLSKINKSFLIFSVIYTRKSSSRLHRSKPHMRYGRPWPTCSLPSPCPVPTTFEQRSPTPRRAQTGTSYFRHMCSLSDELEVAGKLREGELISFTIANLDMYYQPIISVLDVRIEPITVDTLFSLVANFNQSIEMFHGNGAGGFESSANIASRGRLGSGKGGYRKGRGARGGSYGTNRGYGNGGGGYSRTRSVGGCHLAGSGGGNDNFHQKSGGGGYQGGTGGGGDRHYHHNNPDGKSNNRRPPPASIVGATSKGMKKHLGKDCAKYHGKVQNL